MSTELDTAKRMLNVGEKISLKALGEIYVRELSLEDLISLSESVMSLAKSLSTGAGSSVDGFTFLSEVVRQPATLDALKSIAAISTGLDKAQFTNLGLTDWLRWLEAFKKVTNWVELRDLFLGVLEGVNLPELLKPTP